MIPTTGAASQVQGEIRQQRVRTDAGAAPGGAALGNAIDPVCAEYIGRLMLAALEGESNG